MTITNKREVNILLIEDDIVDVLAIQRAFSQHKISNPLRVAKDGVQALEMLRGVNGQPKVIRPLLILLDLNTPRMNGLQFLAELRKDPHLCDHIVFVLTTSKSESDRGAAYQFNVAGYIVKDTVGDDFLQVIRLLDDYVITVELPDRKRADKPDTQGPSQSDHPATRR